MSHSYRTNISVINSDGIHSYTHTKYWFLFVKFTSCKHLCLKYSKCIPRAQKTIFILFQPTQTDHCHRMRPSLRTRLRQKCLFRVNFCFVTHSKYPVPSHFDSIRAHLNHNSQQSWDFPVSRIVLDNLASLERLFRQLRSKAARILTTGRTAAFMEILAWKRLATEKVNNANGKAPPIIKIFSVMWWWLWYCVVVAFLFKNSYKYFEQGWKKKRGGIQKVMLCKLIWNFFSDKNRKVYLVLYTSTDTGTSPSHVVLSIV